MQSLETKRFSGQSSSAQAGSATEFHNEILDMPSPGPILVELMAISNINAAGTGIHSTTRYHIASPKFYVLAARIDFGTNKF
jgi:hypothetical protein